MDKALFLGLQLDHILFMGGMSSISTFGGFTCSNLRNSVAPVETEVESQFRDYPV